MVGDETWSDVPLVGSCSMDDGAVLVERTACTASHDACASWTTGVRTGTLDSLHSLSAALALACGRPTSYRSWLYYCARAQLSAF